MTRSILLAILVLFSSNTPAKWLKVNENAEFSTYANHASIRKAGQIAKMMSMYDYRTVQTHMSDSVLYLSTQQEGEYDCKEEKSRMLANSLYYKKMGGGKVTRYNSRPLEWATVSSKGIDETLWKIACGKSQTHQLR